MKQKPLFEHDCTACKFLGAYKAPAEDYAYDVDGNKVNVYDLYWCFQMGNPTIVARYGNYGGDYGSGMFEFACRDRYAEGIKRAAAYGLRLTPFDDRSDEEIAAEKAAYAAETDAAWNELLNES